MSQDSTRVILSGRGSSRSEIESFAVDPASFLAGYFVWMASTGLPSIAKSAGMILGVSKGPSLSDHKKAAVCRTGLHVPVRAALNRAQAIITISSYANLVSGTDDTLTLGGVAFVAQAGAVTPGQATFQAAVDNITTAQSLANQINDHATTGPLVYAIGFSSGGNSGVKIYAKVEGAGSTGTGNDIGLTYTEADGNVGIVLSGTAANKLDGGSDDPLDIDYATTGSKVYIHDVTGKADVAMNGVSTISDAMYVDPEGLGNAARIGIAEDASEVGAALVDMQGGL